MAMFEKGDLEAARILNDFLPDKIFDAHAHLDAPCLLKDMPLERPPKNWYDTVDYFRETAPLFGSKKDVRINFFILVSINNGWLNREEERRFVREQLDAYPKNVAEVVTFPGDDEDTLKAQLVHPRIVGFKPYHSFLHRADGWEAGIGELLPESAWALADRLGLCITLHMVRYRALADPENLAYIKTMAKKYPNAVLILAHAARAFASWTGVETIAELKGFDNVWFDVAAICESPAIFQILHKVGASRCMWGSDFPVAQMRGKAISLADGFYWIGESELAHFKAVPTLHSSWSIFTENLMATRQACLMAELNEDAVEDIFYNNAMRLFHPDDRG